MPTADLAALEREAVRLAERLLARSAELTTPGEGASRTWTWVCREPLTGTERDLLPFLREQSISIDTQRHGWIAPRADEFLP